MVSLRAAHGGKRRKFVDQKDDALEIAMSVATEQETKVQSKLKRKAATSANVRERCASTPKHAGSTTKRRLEETKALIASRKAQLKKEKVKSRKNAQGNTGKDTKTAQNVDDALPKKKRVAFA